MGAPRLVDVSDRPQARTDGDVLQELAQLDRHAFKGLMQVARWKLQMLKVEPPPLRAKDFVRGKS